MKRMLKRILVVVLVLILLAVAGFGVLYAGRLRTVNSIEQITAYDDYNLYRMDVTYDYSIDDVINYGITDNQSMIDAETPFSFMPSRQMNGAVRQASFFAMDMSGWLAEILSSAASATDL